MNPTEKAMQKLADALADAQKQIASEVHRLQETAAAATCGTIAPIKRITLPDGIGRKSIAAFDPHYGSGFMNSATRAIEAATAALARARVQVEEQHAANLPLLQANKKIGEQVRRIMTHIGIPETTTTYGYATPRARKMTSTTTRAGYLDDLVKHCVVSDGYEEAVRTMDAFERQINEFKQQHAKEEAERERKAQAQRAQQQQLLRLVRLGEKYGVPFPDNNSREPVISALLSKDKYLALAWALEQNRNDWNDGCAFAEAGLSAFVPETPEDFKIVEELHALCESWEGDGRVFRDCEYSYGYLYNKVPDELLSDWQELQSLNLLER